VTKVKVKDSKEFGRHFCSEVHAVEVTAKLKEAKGISENVARGSGERTLGPML
jgi:hypothetical protein